MTTPAITVWLTTALDSRLPLEIAKAAISQTRPPLEIIAPGNVSETDLASLRELCASRGVAVNQLPADAATDTIDTMLETAAGELVYIAAPDRRPLQQAFEKAANIMANQPSAGLCSGLVMLEDEAGAAVTLERIPVPTADAGAMTQAQTLDALSRYGAWFC